MGGGSSELRRLRTEMETAIRELEKRIARLEKRKKGGAKGGARRRRAPTGGEGDGI